MTIIAVIAAFIVGAVAAAIFMIWLFTGFKMPH